MGRKKILLVDDAATILMMEQMILRGPYDLVTAKDGQEAVEKAEVEKPDLILLDVVMPRLGGFEACKQIRTRESTQSIPIIMVTTRSEAESLETGFQNGCNDYVTKPINPTELLEKVKNQLGD